MLALSVLLLFGCSAPRDAHRDRDDRRYARHHGVDNRSYRGY
ncbi:MAG TPA: hypothetical protein VGP55_02130 [Chitinophagaceae bacterium]|nr:hypothetical protein [Chitinophagaceae bacterium]